MPTGDGLLVRLLPAGRFALDAFRALCAGRGGTATATIEVTARGSIQVRGLTQHRRRCLPRTSAGSAIDRQDGVPVLADPLAGADVAPVDPAGIAAELRRALRSAPLALSPKISVVVDGCGGLHLDAVSADIRLRRPQPGPRSKLSRRTGGDGASATWIGTVLPELAVECRRRVAGNRRGARSGSARIRRASQ